MKRYTVSIGIPALNEQHTIKQLLVSILAQKQKGFRLEHIIIALDGSTDNTYEVIKSIPDKRIQILRYKKRLGKATRLTGLFQANMNDILCVFDADIVLRDELVLSKMIQAFSDPRVGLVSANNQPLQPREQIGKIWHAAEIMWYDMRKYADDTKTLFNNSGCSIALRGTIAKKIIIPKDAVADQQFVYLYNHILGGSFYYAKDAYVYYHPPSTLKDILIQYKRGLGEVEVFHKHFGDHYNSYLAIPSRIKRKGLIEALTRDPIYTSMAIVLLKMLMLSVRETNPESKHGTWPITTSTKKPIHL